MALTQIQLAMLQDGILTADTAGRLKMADGFVNAAKLGAGAARANFGAGAVLQVVQTVKTDTFSVYNTTTYTEVTGLSVSITPSSASSKILILAQICVGASSYTAFVRLRRNSTDLFFGDSAGNRGTATVVMDPRDTQPERANSALPIIYLDSPATTSSTTYKIMLGNRANGMYAWINRSHNDNNDYSYDPRTVSSITAMEIAG